MRILCIGDVCGSIGCRALQSLMPSLKQAQGVDFVIVNGENSADGNGITPESAESLFAAGADVITGGNHTLRRPAIHALLDENPRLLRPDNLPSAKYGSGFALIDCGYTCIAVINLIGTVYLENLGATNAFHAADALIEKARKAGARVILVDFHAEATSEKRALGFYLDGKVSALFGTHTHVQTADAQVLPGGTGYMTDLGMTGPVQSVLGVQSSIIIERMRGGKTEKFSLAEGYCAAEGCLFEIDPRQGACLAATRVRVEEARRTK